MPSLLLSVKHASKKTNKQARNSLLPGPEGLRVGPQSLSRAGRNVRIRRSSGCWRPEPTGHSGRNHTQLVLGSGAMNLMEQGAQAPLPHGLPATSSWFSLMTGQPLGLNHSRVVFSLGMSICDLFEQHSYQSRDGAEERGEQAEGPE